MACPKCGGRRHVRAADGAWVRCECIERVITQHYIHARLRSGEEELPEREQTGPVFTLNPKAPLSVQFSSPARRDVDYQAFRYRVWRSLLQHRASIHRYEFMDAYRLVDIQFDKDGTYQTVRELADLDLLVLTLGVSDVPNKLLPPLVAQVVTMREEAGRPTWVFVPHPLTAIGTVYTPDLQALLRPQDVERDAPVVRDVAASPIDRLPPNHVFGYAPPRKPTP